MALALPGHGRLSAQCEVPTDWFSGENESPSARACGIRGSVGCGREKLCGSVEQGPHGRSGHACGGVSALRFHGGARVEVGGILKLKIRDIYIVWSFLGLGGGVVLVGPMRMMGVFGKQGIFLNASPQSLEIVGLWLLWSWGGGSL